MAKHAMTPEKLTKGQKITLRGLYRVMKSHPSSLDDVVVALATHPWPLGKHALLDSRRHVFADSVLPGKEAR